METVDGGLRYRSTLAGLNRLDTEKITRDGVDRPHNMLPSGLSISTAPLPSPTTTHPGPQPPYSSSSSATPPNIGTFEYISPPSSRRTTVDDKASGLRQSLPSIQEALGGDSTMPFSACNIMPALPASSRSTQQASSFGPGQSLPEAPSGPPNPFSQGSVAGPLPDTDVYLARTAKLSDGPSEQDRSKVSFPSINTAEPIPASLHTFDTSSPNPRPTHSMPSYHESPNPNNYAPSSEIPSGQIPPFPSPYAYSTETSNPLSSIFQPVPDYSRFNPAFKFGERKPSIPRSHPVQPYSDSVKRHLDIFDVEVALNEINEGSSRALEFSQSWSSRAHQHSRTAHLPESLPSLPELDDLMRQSGRVVDALGRIKDAAIAQQHALAEEQARALKREHYEDETTGFSGDFKENGGFAAGDSKKRRGKAAPPGRCHSCNRAETPEWRRGPDGARTLCNACGLHYAKLTRKMAVNKNAALSGSNLRPKHSETHSTM